MSTDRREFLGTMLAASVAPMVGATALRRNGGTSEPPALAPSRPSASPWDVSWADKLTGKHKAVFDNVEVSMGLGMLRAQLWLKDYAEVYNAQPADMSGVVVLRHGAIWAIMNDEFWKMHKIGELTKINDPATKAPVTRNPFVGPNVIGLPPALADDVLKKCLAGGSLQRGVLALCRGEGEGRHQNGRRQGAGTCTDIRDSRRDPPALGRVRDAPGPGGGVPLRAGHRGVSTWTSSGPRFRSSLR